MMSIHKSRVSYNEGHLYDGQWSKEGKREGRGLLCLSDGTKYCGEFVNGFYAGHGVLSFPDGSLYEGSFELGKFSGHGLYKNKDGVLFEVNNFMFMCNYDYPYGPYPGSV